MSQISPISSSRPAHSFDFREVQNENGSRTRVYRAKSTDKSGKPQSRLSAQLEGKTKEDTQSLFDSLLNDNERDFSQELHKLNSWLDKTPSGSITTDTQPSEAKKPDTPATPSSSPQSSTSPSPASSAKPATGSGDATSPAKPSAHSQGIPLNDKDLIKAAHQVNKEFK